MRGSLFVRIRSAVSPFVLLVLAACAAPETTRTTDPDTGFIKELPDGVLAIAAPYQNLQAVRVLPEDGCYWYQHSGPVETTLLRLRTRSGNPICTRPQSETPEAG